MTKPTEIIRQAKDLGYETAAELAAFINGFELGHLTGTRDTLDEAIKDVKKSVGDELDFLTDLEWSPEIVITHTIPRGYNHENSSVDPTGNSVVVSCSNVEEVK